MEKLYRFNWDCGRQGELEGLFISDSKDVKESIGKEVYFGEVLGKHSEIYGTLDKEDLKTFNVSQEFIKEFKQKIGSIGYNPIQRIKESEAEAE